MKITDDFNGDTPHLIECIKALIELNDAGALVPHGIGGHARGLLSAAAVRLSAAPPTDDAQVSEMVRTAPARIWIDVSEDEDLHDEPFPHDLVEDMTWSITRGCASTVEYVRADIAASADAQGDDARTPKCWACDGVGQCQVCAPTMTVDDADAVRWRKLCSAIDRRDPWIRAVVNFHEDVNLDSAGLTALIDVPESAAHTQPQAVPGE